MPPDQVRLPDASPWEVIASRGPVACHHCGAPSEVVRRRKTIRHRDVTLAHVPVECLRCTSATCGVIWYGPGQFEGLLGRMRAAQARRP